MSESSSIRKLPPSARCCRRPLTLLQVRQLRSREPKCDRASLPWFPVDESACVKRLDHLVHHRRRHAEEPLEICLGGWRAVNLGVVIDEHEVLRLLGCEELAPLDCRARPNVISRFGLDPLLSHSLEASAWRQLFAVSRARTTNSQRPVL